MTKPHSYEHSNYPDRPITADGVALEHTARALVNGIDRLKERVVTPNSYTVDAQRIPFGHLGDGHLSISITIDEGCPSAILSYQAPAGEVGFLLKRSLSDQQWRLATGSGKQKLNDGAVLRSLDANWPSYIIDNTAIRDCVDLRNGDGFSFETTVGLVQDLLVPHAESRLEERIYAYSHITVDPDGNLSEMRLTLGEKQDHYGLRSVVADITQPYLCDGVSTPLHTRITVDELGEPTLEVWYDHPETGQPVSVPVHDTPALCKQLEATLDELLSEKLPAKPMDR